MLNNEKDCRNRERKRITIFLDIDGVLNRKSDWRNPFTLNGECVSAFFKFLERAKHIYGDAVIVLSSSWRLGLSNTGAIDINADSFVTDMLFQYGITINDVTPAYNAGRQKEIETYIKRHNIENYLVIDDDLSLFETPDSLNIYVTDYRTGFCEVDIDRAIRYLKRRGEREK